MATPPLSLLLTLLFMQFLLLCRMQNHAVFETVIPILTYCNLHQIQPPATR